MSEQRRSGNNKADEGKWEQVRRKKGEGQVTRTGGKRGYCRADEGSQGLGLKASGG